MAIRLVIFEFAFKNSSFRIGKDFSIRKDLLSVAIWLAIFVFAFKELPSG